MEEIASHGEKAVFGLYIDCAGRTANARMTGDQLVKEILKLRPDMPTILCSGFNEKMDEERATEIGIRQYIEKPYDKRFMAKIVRDVLDGK